jgi:hypothetical protein
MDRVRLIKMLLKESCNRVHIGKHRFNKFLAQNDLKADVLTPMLFNFTLQLQ